MQINYGVVLGFVLGVIFCKDDPEAALRLFSQKGQGVVWTVWIKPRVVLDGLDRGGGGLSHAGVFTHAHSARLWRGPACK